MVKASYEKYAKLRDAREMNDYQVSQKIEDLSTAYLTNWKMGRTHPKIDKLMLLGRFFNVSAEFFMEECEENKQEKK